MHPDDRLAEELAQSASALRSLASDLIGRGEADDLVQETMLRAWRSPPPERRGLRPWLATILRNLASNHRRDEERRRSREQEHNAVSAASGGDPREPETLRAVTEALWQLPEPYQRMLTLRYFAGRTPTEIAQQTRSPLATVKSRLRRGLQMLRERLDRDRGPDWRTALCVATGLPLAGAAAATTASILLMAHTTKILFGTAAVAVATLLLWNFGAAVPPPVDAGEQDQIAAVTSDSVTTTPEAPLERKAVAGLLTDTAPDLDHPYAYRLRCRVRDRDGLIVRNASVAIAPRGGRLNRWLERTNDDGEVTLVWRARVSSMTVQIGLMVHQSAEVLREIQVHADFDNQVALLHAHGASSDFCMAARMSSSQSCTSCHIVGTGGNKLFDAALRAAVDLHPFGRFRDTLLGDTGRRKPGFVMIPPPPPPFELEETAEEIEDRDDLTKVRGVVRDADGKPVANTTVIWSHKRDLPVGRTTTNKNGVYSFSFVIPGKVEIRAGGGAEGVARHVLDVAGEPAPVDLYLAPGRTLSGDVHLPKGASADGWRIEYQARDMSFADGAIIKGNSFRLANLPSQEGTLLLWSPHGRLPVVHEPNAYPSAGVTFDLTMQGMPSGKLLLQLPAAEERLHRIEAFVYQVATGRGTMMVRKNHEFELPHLAPGRYRVGLSGPAIGIVDLGEHYVDGYSAADLGPQRLPEPSLLRIERSNELQRIEVYQRRRELDVLASTVRQGQLEFLLPPGDWLVMWGQSDAPQVRAVTVGAEPADLQLR